MPDLESLFEAAAPPATPVDVAAVKARGNRWRRKRMALVVTAVAGVIAVSLPFTVTLVDRRDRSDQQVAASSPPPPATTAPALAGSVLERMPFEAKAVATDRTRLWAIGSAPEGGLRIAELDVPTGSVVRETALPSSASWVALGADHLWVGQAADGAEPAGSLTALDPGTLDVIATASVSSYGAAFHGDTAIVTSGSGDTVALVRVVDGVFQTRAVKVGEQPTNVAVSRSGQVWVQESGGTLAQIDLDGARLEGRVPWEGRLLTGSDAELSSADAVLAVDSRKQVVEVEPRRDANEPNERVRLRTKFDDPATGTVIDGVLWAAGRDGVEAFPVGASNSYATPERDSYSLAVVGRAAYFVAGGGGGGLWRWSPLPP